MTITRLENCSEDEKAKVDRLSRIENKMPEEVIEECEKSVLSDNKEVAQTMKNIMREIKSQ